MALVTLTEIKDYMFGVGHTVGTRHDVELTRLRTAALAAVGRELGGPVVSESVSEFHRDAGGGPLLLRQANATSITSITPTGGVAYDSATYRLEGGFVYPVHGKRSGWDREVQVVYVAGFADVDTPDEVNQAALRYIRWSFQRSHGGSDSYMPGGDDAAPGLGIDGIRKELRFVLADFASVGGIA